ncbi:hypothetical protein VPHK394_0010 [Vibrio phage K394]
MTVRKDGHPLNTIVLNSDSGLIWSDRLLPLAAEWSRE